ncbi:MAG TPA: hypothetical protein VFZ66_08850 [Herpetosiphonaceae bacterium]
MHDIDRTHAEWEYDGQELEQYEYETDGYGEYELEGVFDEAEEMELAVQALEITDEAELDQFIGDLIKKASRLVGKVVRPVGQQLGGMLKQAARQALPMAGAAIGARFGSPQLGSQIGSAAGQMFGLELEGMSGEDQEFEIARQFVRFAGDAVKNAATSGQGGSPQAAARNAIIAAAQQFAPGLLRETSSPAATNGAGGMSGGMARHQSGRRTGRWMRQGNRIVLYGV